MLQESVRASYLLSSRSGERENQGTRSSSWTVLEKMRRKFGSRLVRKFFRVDGARSERCNIFQHENVKLSARPLNLSNVE